jgi:hypothetical protein
MNDGVELAIKAQFRFEPDDFKYMDEHLNFKHWAHLDNSCTSRGEFFYSLAVEVANTSAAIAFEKFKERSPFIYCGNRLAIGSQFIFPTLPKKTIWKVNSFSKDGSKINCGHYGFKGNSFTEQVLVARMSLTKKELKEAEKAYKEAEMDQQRRLREDAEIAHAIKIGQPRPTDLVLGNRKNPKPFDVVLGSQNKAINNNDSH